MQMRTIRFEFDICSLALLGLLLLPLYAFGSDASNGQSTIRVVLNADILSTNPGVRRDSNTDVVLNHIFESLVAYKQDISTGPLVAESFEISEDKKTYTFQIREGLTFHNGEAVTAQDVKWSWDRYLDPETNWKCRRWFVASEDDDGGNQGAVIKSVKVTGQLQIEILEVE